MTLTPVIRDINRFLEAPEKHNLFLLERARDALKCMEEGKVPRPQPYPHPHINYMDTASPAKVKEYLGKMADWGKSTITTI